MNIVLLEYESLGSDIDLTPLRQIPGFRAYRRTGEEQLAERIADADILVANALPMDRQRLEMASRLKLICVTSTGYDHIDVACCKERGIALCNVAGYSTASVVQLTLTMVLALSTELIAYRDQVHSGFYTRNGAPFLLTPVWHELEGKTWGVVGCGNIGSGVARLAEDLGCKVLAYRRKPDPCYETTGLDDLLKQSDIVTVHLPLNESTRGILSREKIDLLKENAIFVNVARGAVADEAALAKKIAEGKLGGLGVDVYSAEPFGEDHPYNRIAGRSNVILTPHSGWGSLESRNRCIAEVAKNIEAFLRGEKRNRIC